MMLNKASLVVLIPALDEEANIAGTLAALRVRGFDSIVVDDGSLDCTAEVAAAAGAQVIRHGCNLGYEKALCSGVRAAALAGYKIVATFDADGQFCADDLVRLAETMQREDSDVVIGVRDRRNRISEHLLALYGNWRFGIRDPLCGMKLYRLASARPYLPFDQSGLVGMELAFRMAAGGCRVSEVTIYVTPRLDGSRYGNALIGNLKILWAFLNCFLIFGWIRGGVRK